MNLVYLTTKFKKKGKKIMKSYVYLLSLLAFFALSDGADIDQILEVNDNNIIQSESSQEKVDNLADEKDSLLAEWKVVVKQVEGLKIYNAQKRQHGKRWKQFTRDAEAAKKKSEKGYVVDKKTPYNVHRNTCIID